MLFAVLAGFLMAFFGSMPPVGPIAVLVLERGVTSRRREGIAIAAGAALAEAVYCATSLAGLSALMSRYPIVEQISRVAGVAMLLGLGVHFARFKLARDPEAAGRPRAQAFGAPFALGFSVSAANPIFVLTWSASIATLLSFTHLRFDNVEKAAFVGGVIAGILGWFWLFLAGLHRYRHHITLRIAERAVRVAGLALIVMAIWGASVVVRTGTLKQLL